MERLNASLYPETVAGWAFSWYGDASKQLEPGAVHAFSDLSGKLEANPSNWPLLSKSPVQIHAIPGNN